MNVASFFSGIGGLDHGLARAGLRHTLFCEKDPYRRGLIEARFPGVRTYGDITDVRGADVAGADLACGGFPCQNLSISGKRAGLEGVESSLFFEFARVVGDVRPEWILIENVPGLFSSQGGRDFGCVLGTLADLGYGVAWRTLDSRYFGVPQRRRRLFILGTRAGGDPRAAAERSGEILALGTRCPRHPGASAEEGEGCAFAVEDGSDGTRVAGPLGTFTGGHKQDLDGNGAYIVSAAFVSENQRAEVLETPYARQLTGGGGKPGQGYPLVRQGMHVRKLTPTECERLQGLPDGWTLPGTDTSRYAAIGDAVTSPVAEWLGRRLLAAGG